MMEEQSFVVPRGAVPSPLSHGGHGGLALPTTGSSARPLKAGSLLTMGAALGATAALVQGRQGRGRKAVKRNVLKKVVEVPEVTDARLY